MKGNRSKLEINSYLYEAGVNFAKARTRRGVKSCLEAIERVSRFAWLHHPGRFADGALENLALEVGRKLEDRGKNSAVNLPLRKRRASRTLHVATHLVNVGGHSRVLVKWVERDTSADHVIVLTDQKQAVPDFLQEKIKSSGNYCVCLPITDNIENRAAAVRSIARSCDRVILYTDPEDTVPVIAFAKEDAPPVAMFNHAHFWFSLGSTVSDVIINTLEYFRKISERYRFARSTALLTGPLGLLPVNSAIIDKEAARRALSLPENATVLMSIANDKYFWPMEGYDFFRTARTLLGRLPDAYLMIVGVKKGSPLVPDDLSCNPHVLLMGRVENPILHYQASDICLESFPFPSLGAVAEAVAYGEAYPVPVYGHGEDIFRVQQTPVLTFPYRPPDEEAYVDYVTSLARRKNEIRVEARKMRTKMEKYDQAMEDHFHSLNSLIDSLKHSPGEIPIAGRIESNDCRTLAERDQSSIGEKIDDLYPFIQSTFHQLGAALKDYQTCGTAIQRMLIHMKMGLSRRAGRLFRQ